ncbi:MAG: hypothetical protein K2M70_10790, partial [Lachnospiraceae bacterium]|nr:hypothetical protein [Lachnospiraceae bacterium]
ITVADLAVCDQRIATQFFLKCFILWKMGPHCAGDCGGMYAAPLFVYPINNKKERNENEQNSTGRLCREFITVFK